MDIKLAKAEAAKRKAKEANETRSTEEIPVEEAPSTKSSPGDDEIEGNPINRSIPGPEVRPWKILIMGVMSPA